MPRRIGPACRERFRIERQGDILHYTQYVYVGLVLTRAPRSSGAPLFGEHPVFEPMGAGLEHTQFLLRQIHANAAASSAEVQEAGDRQLSQIFGRVR